MAKIAAVDHAGKKITLNMIEFGLLKRALPRSSRM